jgi:hypothetical protein
MGGVDWRMKRGKGGILGAESWCRGLHSREQRGISVGAGHFKGNNRFNLKGQMEQRARVMEEKGEKVNEVFVGGSQTEMMKDEIVRMVDSGMEEDKMIRVQKGGGG